MNQFISGDCHQKAMLFIKPRRETSAYWHLQEVWIDSNDGLPEKVGVAVDWMPSCRDRGTRGTGTLLETGGGGRPGTLSLGGEEWDSTDDWEELGHVKESGNRNRENR